MPPAPPMFSTTICWPRLSLTRGAMSRAATSTGPPAVNGTTMVTGRVGHSCAAAVAVSVITVASADAVTFAIIALLLIEGASRRSSACVDPNINRRPRLRLP